MNESERKEGMNASVEGMNEKRGGREWMSERMDEKDESERMEGMNEKRGWRKLMRVRGWSKIYCKTKRME
jgi:hypothetical protein